MAHYHAACTISAKENNLICMVKKHTDLQSAKIIFYSAVSSSGRLQLLHVLHRIIITQYLKDLGNSAFFN